MVDLAKANAIDASTSNCTAEVLAGWKCWDTTVVSSEGRIYKVLFKWSRPNLDSRGSVLMAVGGAGTGESRLDPPSKLMMDTLSDQDKLRVIQIEFTDAPGVADPWGGYWHYAGGYASAAAAFTAAVKLAVEKQIVRGKFLNYLGGSNASMIAAHAMSNSGLGKYFDRVVFQMGPFLPTLASACNPNSSSSIYANSADQQASIFQLMGLWRYGNASTNICSDLNDQRTSIVGALRSFSNTHVHVVVGALEDKFGFGKFIVNSNAEWFELISAKSKSRIVRPEMAHNNSYKDMRRYLKLSPSEVPSEDIDCIDKTGQFCANGIVVQWNCRGCSQILPPTADTTVKWIDQGQGCFHLPTSETCSK